MGIGQWDECGKRHAGSFCRFGAAIVIAVSMTGCKTASISSGSPDTFSTASVGEASVKETAALGNKYRADPKNIKVGIAYSKQLKALGQADAGLKVLTDLSKHHPDDMRLQAYYGKQLVNAGRWRKADGVLRRVIAAGKADWKTYSALGSALDQGGKHEEARQYYQTALKAKPGQISVMNNIGMSYMLQGNLGQAEQAFRGAMATPAGAKEPRIRQNLALTVGLQGRFEEARDIASRDLEPAQVEANMAYLRKMLSQQNRWQKLQTNKSAS